jgi:elongation factor Ts
MAISASDVKKLRELTGAGMMDCKKALTEADGDFEKAEKILKELGLAAVAKRAGRSTEEGRVFTYVGSGKAGILEISCETDFVARNEEFAKTGKEIVKVAVEEGLAADSEKLATMVQELASTIKENMSIKRLEIMDVAENELVMDYIHGEAGSVGVLVKVETDTASILSNDAVKTIAHDLALHAAAFNPAYLNEDAVDSAYIAEQESIFKAQAENMGKPENVVQGIIKGKLKKHLKEIAFVLQPFVKDDKKSVQDAVASVGKEAGGSLNLSNYIVYRSGESA